MSSHLQNCHITLTVTPAHFSAFAPSTSCVQAREMPKVEWLWTTCVEAFSKVVSIAHRCAELLVYLATPYCSLDSSFVSCQTLRTAFTTFFVVFILSSIAAIPQAFMDMLADMKPKPLATLKQKGGPESLWVRSKPPASAVRSMIVAPVARSPAIAPMRSTSIPPAIHSAAITSDIRSTTIAQPPAVLAAGFMHPTILHDCPQCKRTFKTIEALMEHQGSEVAHAMRTIPCPVVGCARMFKTVSGAAHHAESEHAHAEISRHDVTRTIQHLDTTHSVTSVRRQIAGPSTPHQIHVRATKILASEASFDAQCGSYVCFLCSRKLRTLADLQAHLNSPAHDADEFRCPRCAQEFVLVSALAQHFEAAGCMRTTEVEAYLKGLNDRRFQRRQLGL